MGDSDWISFRKIKNFQRRFLKIEKSLEF